MFTFSINHDSNNCSNDGEHYNGVYILMDDVVGCTFSILRYLENGGEGMQYIPSIKYIRLQKSSASSTTQFSLLPNLHNAFSESALVENRFSKGFVYLWSYLSMPRVNCIFIIHVLPPNLFVWHPLSNVDD